MKLTSFLKSLVFIVGLTMVLSACYPGGIVDNDDSDVAITLYNAEVDFTSNNTYSLADTVMEVGDLNVALTGNFDDEILDKVRDNMAALGYTEITEVGNNPPDVVVLVSKTSSTFVDVYRTNPLWWDSWGYYSWWPVYGGIGPGWYPYYPWGGTSVYSYSTGSLLIEMLNPNDQSTQERIPTIWVGAINGFLEGSNASIEARLNKNIDQLFSQSPYLKTQ